MMIALPCVGELVEQPVDLLLGADVDAAGRLVEDEHVAVLGQPLGEDDLLLVAAGEVLHGLVDRRRLDPQLRRRSSPRGRPHRARRGRSRGAGRPAARRARRCRARPARAAGRAACGPRRGSRCRAWPPRPGCAIRTVVPRTMIVPGARSGRRRRSRGPPRCGRRPSGRRSRGSRRACSSKQTSLSSALVRQTGAPSSTASRSARHALRALRRPLISRPTISAMISLIAWPRSSSGVDVAAVAQHRDRGRRSRLSSSIRCEM